jgi:hypothetical protein
MVLREKIINALTGEETYRNYTALEIAEVEAAQAEAAETQAKAEVTAADKAALLAKLGITADEAKLLLS